MRDRNRLPQAISAADSFDGKRIRVGYFGEGFTQMLADVHEFGCNIPVTDKMRGFFRYKFGISLKNTTTVIRIPERSFIRAGWDQHGPGIVRKYNQLIGAAILNGVSPEALLSALALEAQGKLQEFARDLQAPANVGLTVDQKGSSNPLVDSGNMIQSMEHKIE
ncbi:hypothetical protein [Exiguobacterium sp. R-39]|uniref:hypothetical protein n=1 Tax=Exiguobacterium sp. R-39 TaxID=3416708 RepID=UPI003CEDDB04